MATIDAFPFDSQVQSYESDGTPIYDRATDSKGFRNLLKTYFTEGVFPKPSNALQVVENGTLGALVKKGSCMIGGVTILVNEDIKVTFDKATVQSRIDRVVMRVDDTLSVRSATIQVIKGTASSSPTPPQRVYNDTIKDIVLANVTIPANASTITTSNITDTRPDSSICGWVTGTITEIDYSVLFSQYQSQFLDWFNTIKNQLTTDQAGNLQLQIDEINSKLSGAPNENLIVNGYFELPVNQQGENTYSYDTQDKFLRTVDLWRICPINSSYRARFSVYQQSNIAGWLLQTATLRYQDIYRVANVSGYYTFTLLYVEQGTTELKKYSFTYNDDLSSGQKVNEVINNSTSLVIERIDEYTPCLQIKIKTTSTNGIIIVLAKLEYGKNYTGINEKPYHEKHDICLKSRFIINRNTQGYSTILLQRYNINSYKGNIIFPQPMLDRPILSTYIKPFNNEQVTEVTVVSLNGSRVVSSTGSGITGFDVTSSTYGALIDVELQIGQSENNICAQLEFFQGSIAFSCDAASSEEW